MADKVIEVRNVRKRFGDVVALDGVSVTVERGEIFGLIGQNGAGKSTLFKIMLGLLQPTSGEIRIEGHAVQGRTFREAKRRIGYLPENVVLYDNLTGGEIMRYFAQLKGADRKTCAPLLERVGLAGAVSRRAGGYSRGMRQRLGLALAMLGDPSILFLDEPTTGLDPEGIREFYAILHELRGQGVTLVLTSHILAEIQERVDRLAIMKRGKLLALGTVRQLREQIGLPVMFQITAGADGAPRWQEALGNIDGCTIELEGLSVLLHCPRDQKMRVLNALLGIIPEATDVQIHEPSLEDVFLGYASLDALPTENPV
ncbi:MAG: ABC transporter ATP-binding protein [Methylococcaceae bacterium]|nr:ABC transporter ATP-binding protein [Methylococcaceae bacterium]